MQEIPTSEYICFIDENFPKAAKDGDFEKVKLLLADKGIVLSDIYSAMILAINNNHVDIVKLLLSDPRIDTDSVSKAFRRVMQMRRVNPEMAQLLREDKRVNMDDEIRNAHKNEKNSIENLIYECANDPEYIARVGREKPSYHSENCLSPQEIIPKTISYHQGLFFFYHSNELSSNNGNMKDIPRTILNIITDKTTELILQDENNSESVSRNKL